MKLAYIMGLLPLFLLLTSVPCRAAVIEDDCMGINIKPELYNFHAVYKKPATNIDKVGYYDYTNKKQPDAYVLYHIEGVRSIEVMTYSTIGTFFTLDAAGTPIRGQNNSTHIARMLYAPAIRSVLAPFNGTIYYCQKSQYHYKLEPGADVLLDGLLPYGLNVEVSRDGVAYRTLNGNFAVKVYTSPKIYGELHEIEIPSDTSFIRLSVTNVPELDSVPLKISLTRFYINTPEPPPDSSSSSSEDESSSSSEESSGSVSSSSSSSSSSPSAVTLQPKVKPSKQKKHVSKDSKPEAVEQEEEPNKPIPEPAATIPPRSEVEPAEPKPSLPAPPSTAQVTEADEAKPSSRSESPAESHKEEGAAKQEPFFSAVPPEEQELRLSDKIFLIVYVGSLAGFFTMIILRPASRGRRARKKGPKILP